MFVYFEERITQEEIKNVQNVTIQEECGVVSSETAAMMRRLGFVIFARFPDVKEELHASIEEWK